MTGETGVFTYRDDAPMDAIEQIRMTVFVEGQGVPAAEEMDGRDDAAIQFLARAEGTPVGTARLREPDPGVGKAERVAVLADYRGDGWGRRLMEAVEDVARDDGLDRIVLHGQTAVEGFYRSLGYETTSDVFEEVGIPHVAMEKRLWRRSVEVDVHDFEPRAARSSLPGGDVSPVGHGRLTHACHAETVAPPAWWSGLENAVPVVGVDARPVVPDGALRFCAPKDLRRVAVLE